MPRRLAIPLSLSLLLGCAGTETTAPGADATLELSGSSEPVEAAFTRAFTAHWRDSRGSYPATGVTWRTSSQGVAVVDDKGAVTGVTPGSATVTAEALGRSASVTLQVLPLTHYSPLELNVFRNLAFSGNDARKLRKWETGIQIQVSGAPSPEDLTVLAEVAAELGSSLRSTTVSLVEFGGNVQLAFIPDSLYKNMAGGTCAPPATAWGFSCPTADSASRFVGTVVFVSSTRSPEIRRYLIRHELMHMVGFYDHPTGVPSILNRPEQITLDRYPSLDRGLIEMMGRPELIAGMFGVDAMQVLAGLTRLTPPQ